MVDLMRDVKKIAENKTLFYSHRLNSIMAMEDLNVFMPDDKK